MKFLEKVEQCVKWQKQAFTTISESVTSERPVAFLLTLIRCEERGGGERGNSDATPRCNPLNTSGEGRSEELNEDSFGPHRRKRVKKVSEFPDKPRAVWSNELARQCFS